MNKVILICPAQRPTVAALHLRQPLVLAPFVGQSVLEHALNAFAAAGAKQVVLLVNDGAAAIRDLAGHGERWGISLQVITEDHELTVAEARAKHGCDTLNSTNVHVLDRLPQLPDYALWDSYQSWFTAQLAFYPSVAEEQVGMRETSPGVFVGLRSQIAADATLRAPCWIGSQVRIGSGAVIGPEAVIEDGALVDDGAEVTRSVVGPQTYVGAHTEVGDSFAHGADLLNLRTGSLATIPDRFLLGKVRNSERRKAARHESNKVCRNGPDRAGFPRWLSEGRRLLRKLRLIPAKTSEICGG